MLPIPTVSDSLERINQEIERRDNPRDRIMLEIYRDHWWAEVKNDVDGIMATLGADKLSYLFDGIALMLPPEFSITSNEDVRALYQGAAKSGLPMAGPFENERFAFADWGMTFEGLLNAVVRGASLPGYDQPIDPDQLFLVSWRAMSLHPMDLERRLMFGETVYTGSVVRLEAADETTLKRMFG